MQLNEVEIDELRKELLRLIGEWNDETDIATKYKKRQIIDQKSKELKEIIENVYRKLRLLFFVNENLLICKSIILFNLIIIFQCKIQI